MKSEILTDEFLKKIRLRNYEQDSLISFYAIEQERLSAKIEQLRRMWRQLPENIKADKDLFKSLHSTKDGQFQGAISELISGWVLKNYFQKVLKDVNIAKYTPDFMGINENHKLLFETFTLGQGYEDKKSDQLMKKLRKELNPIVSQIGIFLVGRIYPNKKGNFDGMKDAVESYLTTIDPNDDGDHEIEVSEAKISFSAYNQGTSGKILHGRSMGVSSGDAYAEKLLRSTIKKKDKYNFPHLEICVSESIIGLTDKSIEKALIGDRRVYFDRETHGQIGSDFSNDGFWGIQNPDLDKNLHVQGFIFIWQQHLENNEMQLKVGFVDNFQVSASPPLSEIFNDIPNIFSKDYKGQKLILRP